MNSWLDKFPRDVQVEILKGLPLKSLLRLMSTCKSIYAIISSPTLMLASSIYVTGYRIYSYHKGGLQRFLSYSDTGKEFKFFKKISSISIEPAYSLLGSIYGLVCFAKIYHPTDSNIILWNPFLGKSLMLPTSVPAHGKSCAIGFGFDRFGIDYKVVRIEILPDYNKCWADVYTLHSRGWKTVNGSLSKPVSSIMEDGIFLNNSIHWITKGSRSCHGQNRDQYSILTYNLYKEEFTEMDILENMGHKFMTVTKITIHGEEKLVLYHDDQSSDFYVWVMEEYGVTSSWTRVCVMESKSNGEYIKVLHTRKNGEIVLSTSKGRLLLCKIEGDDKKTIITDITVVEEEEEEQEEEKDKKKKKKNVQLDYVGPFVGSLVFVDEQCTGALCGKRIRLKDDEFDEEEEKKKMKNMIKRAQNNVGEQIQENVNRQHESVIKLISILGSK